MAKVPPKRSTKRRQLSHYICQFPGCPNTKPYKSNNNDSELPEVDKIFHKFPSDPTSRDIWLQICDGEDESKFRPADKRQWYVCGDHFCSLDYKQPLRQRNLKPGAVPKTLDEIRQIDQSLKPKSNLDEMQAVVYTYYGPNSVQMQDGGSADEFVDLETDKAFIITKPNVSLVTTAGYMTKDEGGNILVTDPSISSHLANNISTLDTSITDLNTDAIMTDINNATGVDTMSTDVDTLATDVESMATTDCDCETEETDAIRSLQSANNCFQSEIDSDAIISNFDTINHLNLPSSNDFITDLNTNKSMKSANKISLENALNTTLETDFDPFQFDSEPGQILQNGLSGKATKLLKISRQDALKCGTLSSDDVNLSPPLPKCIRIANTEENLNILQLPNNVSVDKKKDFIEITPPKKFLKISKNALQKISPKKNSLGKLSPKVSSDEILNFNDSSVEKMENSGRKEMKIDEEWKSPNSSFMDNYCSFLTGFRHKKRILENADKDNVEEIEISLKSKPSNRNIANSGNILLIETLDDNKTGESNFLNIENVVDAFLTKSTESDKLLENRTENTDIGNEFLTDFVRETDIISENTKNSDNSDTNFENPDNSCTEMKNSCKSDQSKSNVIVNSVKIINPPILNQNVVNNQIGGGTSISESSSCFDKSEATVKLSEFSYEDEENSESDSEASDLTIPVNHVQSVNPFLQKQLRNMKFQNVKLKRLLAKERSQLKSLRKLYVRKHYEFMDENLPKVNRDFINCQLRNFRSTAERVFNENDLAFALQLYQRSRELYNYLSTEFALPPREAFVQLFSNRQFAAKDLEMTEGVNVQVLENLRNRASQMLDNDRVCSLLFAEVSFEDLTGTVNKVLVFMVRGLQKDFLQIVAYFTYQEPDVVAPEALQDVIKSIVISLLDAGLRVIALVTNFSEFSYRVFNKLNNNENIELLQLPIVIKDAVLYPIFNAPNLLINLLDLFRVHKIYFTTNENSSQYNVAEYSNLLAAFNHDSLRRFPRLSGLSLDDFTSSENPCSSIGTAVRQFSYSMASAIENYALNNVLNRKALDTAEFIDIVDKLFDSVNSSASTVKPNKPLTQLLAADSKHLQFWQYLLDILRYWQIGDASSADLNNTLFGWQITIASIVGIWEQLQEMEVKQMALRKLNLEPLESAISSIYTNDAFVANPTIENFVNGMRGVVVDNMLLPIVPEE